MIHITDHFERGLDRLIEQFRELPNLEALLEALIIPIQELEDVIFDMLDSRSIFNAMGLQLDLYGDLLNKARAGLADDEYRIVLLAKVAQNISEGTAEDVMQVYQLLMRASYVQYYEDPDHPATFSLTAIGASPIGSIDSIKAAVRGSKAGGTKIDLLQTITGNPLVFLDDPDPNGRGLGDVNDPTVGGVLSSII